MNMDALYIVTVYVVLDDSLKAMQYEDDVRSTLSAAEILTVGIVAARYFQNHHERALQMLTELGYLPRMSVSRFNRRLHQMVGWLQRLGQQVRQGVALSELFLIDAFPLPVCQRVRQHRCRKVRGEAFLGRCEAKRMWFFGYKLHWCCDSQGIPVAFTLRPARRHERSAVTRLLAHLPAGATVLGDGSYVSQPRATFWLRHRIRLIARRYGRMSPNTAEERTLLAHRQLIETAHSQLESMGLQRLRARTRTGFCLKVLCSLLALTLIHLVPN
jgi:IS5 family transposase